MWENGVGWKEYTFLFISSKSQIFIPAQNLEGLKEIKLDLMIFLL